MSRVLVSLFVNKKALVRWDFYVLCFKNMVFFLTIPFEPCQLESVRATVPFSHLSFVWDAARNPPWDRVLWGHWVLLHMSWAHLISQGSASLVKNCWCPAGPSASSMPDTCPVYLSVWQLLGRSYWEYNSVCHCYMRSASLHVISNKPK